MLSGGSAGRMWPRVGILTDLMSCKFFVCMCLLNIVFLSRCWTVPCCFTMISSRTPICVSSTLLFVHTGIQYVGCAIHCFDCVKHISLLRCIKAARQSLIGRQGSLLHQGRQSNTSFFFKVSHFVAHCGI